MAILTICRNPDRRITGTQITQMELSSYLLDIDKDMPQIFIDSQNTHCEN
jgi:hypothetical protein